MSIIAILIILMILIQIEIKLYNKYMFKGLTYNCDFSASEIYEGEAFEIIETVSNNKKLPLACLKSEINTSKYIQTASAYTIANDQNRVIPSLFAIRGHQKITRRWKVKALKRGCFEIKEVTLVSADLLGVDWASDTIKLSAKITVLPKPLDCQQNLFIADSTQGERVVKRFILEDPFYIVGVRPYTQREPLNKIHWGMTARHHELMVYNNAPTTRASRHLILNMQSHDYQRKEVINEDKVEQAIRICSWVLEQTQHAEGMIGFSANTQLSHQNTEVWIRAGMGEQHVHHIRETLAYLPLVITQVFEDYLHMLKLEPETTELIVVSSYLTEPIAQSLRKYAQQGISIKVIVLEYPKEQRNYPDIACYYLGGVTV